MLPAAGVIVYEVVTDTGPRLLVPTNLRYAQPESIEETSETDIEVPVLFINVTVFCAWTKRLNKRNGNTIYFFMIIIY
ncbi:hypothetical protein HYN49_01470 [Flavobacterium pallidum]|uniref:Uncharacterized protein n=1 Tax=Flavobacterium pallidum TaxID=2172098 RepID=A0A2S1SE51_9FLAO|nr:hypothetical protein HYN49_01470 [Flavobacterium pallidum]